MVHVTLILLLVYTDRTRQQTIVVMLISLLVYTWKREHQGIAAGSKGARLDRTLVWIEFTSANR